MTLASTMFDGTEPGGVLAPELPGPPRRALICAGGGLKVAFQAGVLQVWLDEARDGGRPLEFVHADGASGGVYNLAMWCQGMSGTTIADNWRRFRPMWHGLGVNLRGWPRGESLFGMGTFRTRTLRGLWKLDWDAIARTRRSATFNLFDVDGQRLVTLPPAAMSEDHLVAATSLPGWYPPVPIRGRNYIDGVFVTDANLDAAIEAGADELWIVWTVSTRGRWHGGPVNQYFQVIEACANGNLRRDLDRIARSNRAHAQGRPAEFPRPVRVAALEQEVPAHYLFTFRRSTIARAVEAGVATARTWCRDRELTLVDGPPPAGRPRPVHFTETMTGTVGGAPGAPRERMTLHLDVDIADLAAFLADPNHLARVSGTVECPALGGTAAVTGGSLALLPVKGAGTGTTMEYRLRTVDESGRAVSVLGTKTVRDDPGPDMWADTTTLDVTVTVDERPVEAGAAPVLGGTLRMTPLSFLRVLASVRGWAAPAFAVFFVHRLVQLYLLAPARRSTGSGWLDGWPVGLGPAEATVFVENEQVVAAPRGRVWEVLVRAGAWHAFYDNAHLVRIDGDPAGVLRLGARFRMVTFCTPVRCEVTLFDPVRGQLGWTWRGLGAHGFHLWSLRDDPEGTRADTQETQFGVLPWLTRPVLRRAMHAGHAAWLHGLGRTAESLDDRATSGA